MRIALSVLFVLASGHRMDSPFRAGSTLRVSSPMEGRGDHNRPVRLDYIGKTRANASPIGLFTAPRVAVEGFSTRAVRSLHSRS